LTATPHLISKHLIEAVLLDPNFKNALIDAYEMKGTRVNKDVPLDSAEEHLQLGVIAELNVIKR
jgi:hypothetical protein